MGEQALQSLEAALRSKVEQYSKLGYLDLVQTAIDLIDESAVEYDRTETIPVVLARLAAMGSIDAVAVMSCLGCAEDQVADALQSLSERSPDVMDGLLFVGLARVVEDWAESEVAAGRMTKTICPNTGKPLYGSAPKK
ncbi:hypothetical protein ACVILK_000686 [Bradyrhizobium embrapense]